MDIVELKKRAKNIKLVISDLDGSLLDSNKMISGDNVDAIKKLRSIGVNFTIATGRMFDTLSWYLNTVKPDVLVAATNGGEVIDPKSRRVVYRRLVDHKTAIGLSKAFIDEGLNFCCECVNLYLVPKYAKMMAGIKRGLDRTVENGGTAYGVDVLSDPEKQLPENDVLKIVLNYLPGEKNKIEEIMSHYDDVESTTAADGIFEIIPKGVDKSEALKIIAEKMGYSSNEICAIGDFDNDVKMLKYAGIGVSMGNGTEEAKRSADYITLSNDENGVAKAIEKLFL